MIAALLKDLTELSLKQNVSLYFTDETKSQLKKYIDYLLLILVPANLSLGLKKNTYSILLSERSHLVPALDNILKCL